jgi:hypothetical protein
MVFTVQCTCTRMPKKRYYTAISNEHFHNSAKI